MSKEEKLTNYQQFLKGLQSGNLSKKDYLLKKLEYKADMAKTKGHEAIYLSFSRQIEKIKAGN